MHNIHSSYPARRLSLGFTLVEVLVALLIMAILAAMGWQGIAGMLRSRDAAQGASEQTLRLATVVAQWEQDLQNVHDSGAVPPLRCDGATLRLTRRAEGGVQMVVWSLQEGQWRRWAGPVATRMADLQDSWMRSQQLMGREDGQLDLVKGVNTWQVYFFQRNDNGWSNCQSSGDNAQDAAQQAAQQAAEAAAQTASAASAPLGRARTPRTALPAGVRLVIEFEGQRRLTRDVVLQPQMHS